MKYVILKGAIELKRSSLRIDVGNALNKAKLILHLGLA